MNGAPKIIGFVICACNENHDFALYKKNQSVEFFRNVPINELWKYSNGKYNRTDFIIKEFKF
jgi:hypothetical protein